MLGALHGDRRSTRHRSRIAAHRPASAAARSCGARRCAGSSRSRSSAALAFARLARRAPPRRGAASSRPRSRSPRSRWSRPRRRRCSSRRPATSSRRSRSTSRRSSWGAWTRRTFARGTRSRRGRSSSSSTRATSASRSRAPQARVAAARARAATARAPARRDRRSSATARSSLADTGAIAQATADDLARARQVARGAGARGRRRRRAPSQAEVNALSDQPREHDDPRAHRRHGHHQAALPGDVVSPGTLDGEDRRLLARSSSRPTCPRGACTSCKKGGPCEIVLDAYPDKRWRGEVVEVAPAAQPRQGDGTVKVRFLDRDETRAPRDGRARVFLEAPLDAAQAEGAAEEHHPRRRRSPSARARRSSSSIERGQGAHGARDAGPAVRRRLRAHRRPGARHEGREPAAGDARGRASRSRRGGP